MPEFIALTVFAAIPPVFLLYAVADCETLNKKQRHGVLCLAMALCAVVGFCALRVSRALP